MPFIMQSNTETFKQASAWLSLPSLQRTCIRIS